MPAAGNGTPPGAALKKAKKRTVVKAPAGDVASSGGDYGTKAASQGAKTVKVKRNTAAVYKAQPVAQRQAILKHATGPTRKVVRDIHEQRRQRAEELAHSLAEHDIMTAADKRTADAFNAAHPIKRKQTQADLYLKDPAALKAAGFKGPGVLDKIAQSPGKFTANTFTDAAELAATTPTSTAILAKTAVTHPTKLPGMLAAPYKQLLKNPAKFAFDHPVTTALMGAPVTKVPGLAVGKGLRLAGKQTLRGETRTLPGTALRQETRRSKDALKNAQQARAEARNPTPTISDPEIRRRVDEHFEYRRKHTRRVEAAALRDVKQRTQTLPKDQRQAAIATHVEGARGGAKTQNARTFAKEFGSTWYVGKIPHPSAPKPGTPEFATAEARYRKVQGLKERPGSTGEGAAAQAASERVLRGSHLTDENGQLRGAPLKAILKPKNATEGFLHATREDAQLVVNRLAKAGHGDFTVHKVSDGEYGVVPKTAARQLERHQKVGSSSATYAKLLRASRQKFTNAVLPLSPKWLTGQLVEGSLRMAAHGAGPMSLLRERRVFNALEKQRPGAGKEFRARALPGGHYGGQVQEFRTTPLHELFSEADDGKIGDWLARAGRAGEKAPGARRVVNGWNRYTRTVFDQVNGRFIENTQQRAMLGRSLKDSPLMERKLLGLSKKAAEEAARGLRGTETQVQFGRAVERAYGKYSNFSPSQRERNLHWTPFLPWYSNAIKFLTVVLPRDHPVLSSLLAAGNVGTQKDREKLGLSLHGAGRKPLFMQGGIPSKGGNVVRIGHYTPFGIGETPPLESAASLVVPQFTGTLKNMAGIDWKNQPLKKGGPHGRPFTQTELAARAAATQAEALIPGAGQAARLSGLEDKLSGKDKPTVLSGKDLAAALRKEVDPFISTGTGSKTSSASGRAVKVTPVKIKPVRIKPVRVKPVS